MGEGRDVRDRGIGGDFEGGIRRESFDGGCGWVDGRYGEGAVCVPCEYCLC